MSFTPAICPLTPPPLPPNVGQVHSPCTEFSCIAISSCTLYQCVYIGTRLACRVCPCCCAGPGEPFATAAGVLGLMALWRAFYTVYLDFWNIRTLHGSPVNRYQDMLHFVDALRSALFVSIAFCIVLQFLSSSLGEEGLEQLFSAFRL